jgi:hypothetical protein
MLFSKQRCHLINIKIVGFGRQTFIHYFISEQRVASDQRSSQGMEYKPTVVNGSSSEERSSLRQSC